MEFSGILCLFRGHVLGLLPGYSYFMMTSSNGNIFRVTGPLCGEFTGPGEFPTQRPVTRSFDVFFDLRPNKRLSKQWWGWWFETLSRPFWRHRNVTSRIFAYTTFGVWCLANNRYLDLHMYIQVDIAYIPIYLVKFQVRQFSLQM